MSDVCGRSVPEVPNLTTASNEPGRELVEASVRLGHKRLRTLMKRSSLRYLPGA